MNPHMNAAMPERRPATEEISGVIEMVTFRSEDSGYCVLRVKSEGHREETTVVGSLHSGGWFWSRTRRKVLVSAVDESFLCDNPESEFYEMSATDTFESASAFVERLHSLRQSRRGRKLELRDQLIRRSLSCSEREEVFAKTGGRCHICGGLIEDKWQADHLVSHSLGGPHSVDNYLPAHSSCNGYRFF